MNTTKPLIVITGPTAVGKTRLAVNVADRLQAEIINADSRQVYKRMDIGTGKDLTEYTLNGKQISYHLINICEPGYRYNIKEYQHDFTTLYEELASQDKTLVLCGGSGLYVESALKGNPYAFIPIDQQLRDELGDLSKSSIRTRISAEVKDKLNISTYTTPKRLVRAVEISNYLESGQELEEQEPLDAIIFVLTIDRALVKERIFKRLNKRLKNGMIEEVQELLDNGLKPEQLLYYGLEYRWITLYIIGEITYEEMVDRLNISIRQFAKRQMTWFRRMEKKGYQLNWLDGNENFDKLSDQIVTRFKEHQKPR